MLFVPSFGCRAFLILAVVLAATPGLSVADPPPKSIEDLAAIVNDWQRAQNEHNKLLQQTKNGVDREKLRVEKAPNAAPFADRCLKLAEKYPGTVTELTALWWAVCHAPETEAGKKAYDKLAKGRVTSADLGDLATAFESSWEVSNSRKALGLAPIVLDRVKRNPDHPKAALLLNWVCSSCFGEFDQQDPPVFFREAADLIVARYANSPDITNFCECLGVGTGSPPWAGKYEKHLRTILKENRDRRVRGGAAFALAAVVHFTGGEARQDEADKLYQEYLNNFDGSDPENGSIEQALRKAAKAAREELRWRAVGKPAPEIEGKDLEGRPLKLSDRRGKVVLLSFWETSCFPCMKFVPHERALVDRLRDKPFVLLGVNCDTDDEAVKNAVVKHKITWPSFRNKRGEGPTISAAWDIIGLPTLFLLDDQGIIRKRWVGPPTPEELNRAVDELIDKAARKDK
jgi:thiol-disulfide isomerase/thioredoxin